MSVCLVSSRRLVLAGPAPLSVTCSHFLRSELRTSTLRISIRYSAPISQCIFRNQHCTDLRQLDFQVIASHITLTLILTILPANYVFETPTLIRAPVNPSPPSDLTIENGLISHDQSDLMYINRQEMARKDPSTG
jgi:hypothetical protein